MRPEPQEPKKDVSKDLKTFEELPAKTKELLVLKDESESTTGREAVALNKKIQDKSVSRI